MWGKWEKLSILHSSRGTDCPPAMMARPAVLFNFCPFNILTKPHQASEPAEPLAALRHHAGTIARSRADAGQKVLPRRGLVAGGSHTWTEPSADPTCTIQSALINSDGCGTISATFQCARIFLAQSTDCDVLDFAAAEAASGKFWAFHLDPSPALGRHMLQVDLLHHSVFGRRRSRSE